MVDAQIAVEDPRADDIQALLASHLAFANTHSPREDVHALDLDGLLDPAITFFAYRDDAVLLAVGALKQLTAHDIELKSMHTAADARGRGIGRAVLEHLVTVARERGCRRMYLETGSMTAFAPARALYASAGFEACEPFGSYRASVNSTCMTRSLES